MSATMTGRKVNGECWECATVGIVAPLGTDVGVRLFCENCYRGRSVGLSDDMDWANVPDPEDVPRARFRLESVDSDTYSVVAFSPLSTGGKEPPYEPVKIGELFFNGNEWYFIRWDRAGAEVGDDGRIGADEQAVYIPVDPDQEALFRTQEENIRIQFSDQTTALPLLAELKGRRELHRDESRDLAEIGAKIEARKWWPLFWSPDKDV